MPLSCAQCRQAFELSADDRRLLDQFAVPNPKMCPPCRLQRRLCERNTRNLYYRKCDLTGKQIVSQYHDQHPFPVYGLEEWGSDAWDAQTYGRTFDFAQPFFPQFESLMNVVPHMGLFNTPGTMENSEFNNCTGYLKNCYLICESDLSEDCYYSNLLKKCKDTVDCSVCYSCERCYECIDCLECHSLQYSQNCKQCSDSYFLQNCHGCRDCIGCVNQRNKQYMIANKQLTKEAYELYKQQSALHTRSGLEKVRRTCEAFFATQPFRAQTIEQSEGCTGDRIYTSKQCTDCFDIQDCEDCHHCERLSLTCKSCMDFNSWGQSSELVYQCSSTGDRTYNSKFCSNCITVSNAEYCFECLHCQDVFGCIGLRHKRFCIFNVQYTEAEYHALKDKMIAHMRSTGEYGEFFPMSLCPFAYNESFAPDLCPLTQAEVVARGWKWMTEDDSRQQYMGVHISMPETIGEVAEDITKKILLCSATGKAYKIIPQELAFYRSMNIPAPTLCPDERHRRRTARRTPYTLLQRACGKCNQMVHTTYTPAHATTVYCEACYLSTVY